LAARIVSAAGPDVKSQIVLAWRLVFGADPTESESADAVMFVTAQTEVFHPKPATAAAPNAAQPPIDPARQALSLLCQSLLSSNRFLYVE
jgi:hypothetical protein